jgi:site-specific DNA recombinase
MRLLHAARLSRLRDDSTGIEKQDEQAAQYSAAYGHEIVATAADTDVSGSTDPMKRPKLGPYLTDPLLINQYDGIIASALDRFGRNASHLVKLRDWAIGNGKTLIIISPALQWPPQDANDFATRMVWGILGDLAEYELVAITKRNQETQQWLRTNGYLHGKPPFGYAVVDKDNHKTLAPDPGLSEVIQNMADRYLKGATLTELAEWLDAEQVKPPSSERWAQNSLRRLLGNPALMGRRKDASGRTILKFKPILDEVTFRRVQAELERRAKPRGAQSDESLLSGIIHCANCGRPMSYRKTYAELANGERAYHYYYRCHGTAREPSRCKNMITVDFADEAMSSWVTDVIGYHEVILRTIVPGHGHEEEITDVEAEIRALDLDDPEYDTKSAALRAERKRLKELPAVPAEVREEPSGLTVREFWESLESVEVKREWLKSGQVKILAYKPPVKGPAPEGAPGLTFSVEALFGADWSILGDRWAEGVRRELKP